MRERRSFPYRYPWSWTLICICIFVSVMSAEPAGVREPGEPTWGRMATDALRNNEIERAIMLFEKWLEADPSSDLDWYNYSCALSLHGDTMKVLEALSNAVKAGYRDSSWAANDTDLTILRGLPDFKNLLTDMSSRKRQETHTLGQWRYLPQKRQGRYLLRLPAAVSENTDMLFPSVMLLHGRGSNAERYVSIAEKLNLPDVIFILPEAPFACDDREHGFEFWPRVFWNKHNMNSISRQCSLNAIWLKEIVRDAAFAAPIDTNRVIVTGFSQGGASSFMAVLEYPDTFIGAAPLGGWLFEEYADSARFASLAANDVSLFIGHGENDESVELKHAEEARRFAEIAGVKVVYKTYPVGHRVTTEMIDDLRNWITDLIRK